MSSTDWLRKNFKEVLLLNDSASNWLIMLFDIIQTFDDYADNDKVTREELDNLIWNTLVLFPTNQFYLNNVMSLTPMVSTMVLKWQASDKVELEKKHNEVSFVWRAGYYDIILFVVALCNGAKFAKENSHLVMSLYGEKYEDYKKEF